MKGFSLSERFRLELHWKKVKYEQDGQCDLLGAYFTGPVLSIAQKIEPNNNIMLDFYSQYLYLVKSVFVAKLTWGDVEYSNDGKRVDLKNVKILHEKELNNVPTFLDNDWFLIDTKGHDPENHSHNLVYKTYVMNPQRDLYRFRK